MRLVRLTPIPGLFPTTTAFSSSPRTESDRSALSRRVGKNPFPHFAWIANHPGTSTSVFPPNCPTLRAPFPKAATISRSKAFPELRALFPRTDFSLFVLRDREILHPRHYFSPTQVR
jgi:hypothetical protein